MIEQFDNIMQSYAIEKYLRSFGYKAQVDANALITYVQDPIGDTFVVRCIPTWEIAKEFIALRSNS
jgi:hypothetical protein